MLPIDQVRNPKFSRGLPKELTDKQNWLVWRFVQKPGKKKRDKLPFYANGIPRNGTQGSAEDRASLATYQRALQACEAGRYDGIGFAILEGCGVSALDLDRCIVDGKIDPRVEPLTNGTYSEISPSGSGLRIFFTGGNLPNAKDVNEYRTDGKFDLECFSGNGFVTVTGNRLNDVPDTLREVTAEVELLCRDRLGNRSAARAPAGDDDLLTLHATLGWTHDELRAILNACDPSVPRDDWLRASMAAHHEMSGSTEACEIFDEWSSLGSNYTGRASIESAWRSFRPRPEPITGAWLLRFKDECVARRKHDAVKRYKTEINDAHDEFALRQKLCKKIAADDLDDMGREALAQALTERFKQLGSKYPIAQCRKLLVPYVGTSSDEPITHHGYAKAFLQTLEQESGGHSPVGAEGSIYVPQPSGLYKKLDLDATAVRIADLYDGGEKCERVADYRGIASQSQRICDQPDFFDHAPKGLAAGGYFYRLQADGSIDKGPLVPAHRQRHMHPLTLQAGAMPLFSKFLEETFESSVKGEADSQISQLQEIAGATTFGLMAQHEKAVLFYGPGRAGKGTVLKIFEDLVPPDSRASVSPFQWEREYYLASLADKLLNTVGEMTEGEPMPAAAFKTVLGRDQLTARNPTHRPFNFRNQAAHIFNSNSYPNTRDHSEAFFTRWVIVAFANSRISRGEIDTELAARIVASEMSQILAWAMEGAQRLHRRGRFEITETHRRHLAVWQRRTDSVMEFLHDDAACTVDEFELFAYRCKRSTFYEAYSSWCNLSGRKAIAKQKFNDLIEAPTVAAMGLTVKRHPVHRELVHGLKLIGVYDGYDAF